MRALLFVLMLAVSLPAAAQPGRGKGQPGQDRQRGQSMSNEDRRQLREDVNSARRDYGREERQRRDRMAPEEREKLRRDVQDANRDMRKR